MDESKAELFEGECVTLAVAVKRWGISKREFYRMMAAGELPFGRRGKRRLIPVKAMGKILAASSPDIPPKG